MIVSKLKREISFTEPMWFTVVYFLIASGDLAGRVYASKTLDYIFKPMLLLALALYFLMSVRQKGRSYNLVVLGALFFCWLGDISLMFEGKAYFLAGLSFFLIGHLFYISSFTIISDKEKNYFTGNRSFILIPLFVYALAFYVFLYPYLTIRGMHIPVFAYSLVLAAMGIFAQLRYRRVSKESFWLVFSGAIAFMLSDSLIGFRTFYMDFPGAGFWVMITYIFAQYLIVKGCVIHSLETEE